MFCNNIERDRSSSFGTALATFPSDKGTETWVALILSRTVLASKTLLARLLAHSLQSSALEKIKMAEFFGDASANAETKKSPPAKAFGKEKHRDANNARAENTECRTPLNIRYGQVYCIVALTPTASIANTTATEESKFAIAGNLSKRFLKTWDLSHSTALPSEE